MNIRRKFDRKLIEKEQNPDRERLLFILHPLQVSMGESSSSSSSLFSLPLLPNQIKTS